METATRQDLSTTSPLSSISPRRISSAVNNRESTSSAATDSAADKQAEAQYRQQEQRVIQQLKARDQEVRAHEAAHLAAGRPYVTSGPSYTYQTGPDGRSYAIGGEVGLDVSAEPEPDATLSKAETVHRAALAPAQPSPQDLRVAANAAQLAAQARVEIATQRRLETQTAGEPEANGNQPVSSGAVQSYSDLGAESSTRFSQYA
jgi:hypothetical protein